MTIRLLYPANPLELSQADEPYQEEYQAALAQGLNCSLFEFDNLAFDEFKPKPRLAVDEVVLYRGWMLTVEGYEKLVNFLSKRGAQPFTNAQAYRRCHHLPGWYETCKDLTAETIICEKDADFEAELAEVNWPGFFVKDFVKSNSDGRGSVAKSPQEIPEIITLLEQYRGEVEGGICVRKLQSFEADSEERYFVLNGQAFAQDGEIPAVVQACAERIDSPFFSVDVARTAEGDLQVVELGDGQVSDRKQWPVDRFIQILSNAVKS